MDKKQTQWGRNKQSGGKTHENGKIKLAKRKYGEYASVI